MKNRFALIFAFITSLLAAVVPARATVTNFNGFWSGNFNGYLYVPCNQSYVQVSEPQEVDFFITNSILPGSTVSGFISSSGFKCFNDLCIETNDDNYAGPISGTVTGSNTIQFNYAYKVNSGYCAGVESNITATATLANGVITGNWNETGTFTFTNQSITPASPQISVFYGAQSISNNEPGVVNVGSTPRGYDGSNVVYTIINSGSNVLSITAVTVPKGFFINALPGSLAPGEGTNLIMQLDPTVVGTYSGNLVISNSDPANGAFIIPVSGTVTGGVIALGGDLNFGSTLVGTTNTSFLIISNIGNETLDISNINTITTIFPVAFSNVSIAPGSNISFQISFIPGNGVGEYEETIGVLSDGSGVDLIGVTGVGTRDTLVVTITTNGPGSVRPNLNGKSLLANHRYTIAAVPDKGYLFAGWTGTVISSANPLTFVMKAGTVLQANFAFNPFQTIKGSFNGLFSDLSGVTEISAGMVKNLVVSSQGAYTGSLLLAGAVHPLSGRFAPDGVAVETVNRTALQGGPLTLNLLLTNSTGAALQLTGTVSNASWVSELVADIGTNIVPSGESTVLIPPAAPDASYPQGDGYILINNTAGVANNPITAHATLAGLLADGTPFNETVPVSYDGYVPVYASLYGNKGLITGWLNLLNPTTNDVALTWIRPAKTGIFYQDGFSEVITNSVLQFSGWTNSSANYTGYTNLNLAGSNYDLTISSAGHISGTGVAGLVNPRNGSFVAAVKVDKQIVVARGAILPATQTAGGYTLSKTNSEAAALLK